MKKPQQTTERSVVKRLFLGLIFVPASLFLGFSGGGLLYSVLASAQTGLAGATEAAVSGFVFALTAGILSGVLVWRWPVRRLLIATPVTFILAVIIFAFLVFQA